MTYQDANIKLGTRDSRKLQNNTYLQRRADGSIAVKLHGTDVIRFYLNGSIVLNTGGWNTVTTKDRINTYLPKPWRVGTDAREFSDYMILYRDRATPWTWTAKAVLNTSLTIPARGTFSRAEALKLKTVRQHCRDQRNTAARNRYREMFWIRKARQGGKVRKPLTLEMIQAEQNTTIRAAMIKVYGMERFFTQIQAQVLDSHRDYQLLTYSLNNWNHIRVLKMVCPSTKTVYIHPVEPSCETVSKALDWMFQTDDYLGRLAAEA